MGFQKGQSAIEFIIIIGAVTFFFLAFLMAIQQNLADERERNIDFSAKEIALTVQNEIDIASKATDGYYRTFKIPERLLNLEYDIDIVGQNVVYIRTDDESHALSLPVANVTGNVQKGSNIIEALNKTVYLNR